MSAALILRPVKLTLLAGLMALSACSSDALTPPAAIDGETEVSSITPARSDLSVEDDVRAYGTEDVPVEAAAPVTTGETALPPIDAAPKSAMLAPADDGSVNMDAALGVDDPGTIDNEVTGLAEDQDSMLAEGTPTAPVVDGIGTEDPVSLTPRAVPVVPSIAEANEEAPLILPSRRKTEEAPGEEVAFVPRFTDPMQVPETLGGMSDTEKACRRELKRMGAVFEDLDPIRDSQACGIAHPVKLKRLSGNIEIKPAAVLNCRVSLAFAKWVKNELQPSARMRYFSGVKTVHQMSAYSCRRMNSSARNPWSEHARGNAIDVGKFTLNSGKVIVIRSKGFFAFREKGLLKAVRADSCKYFTTVLGPGSDVHHKDHFHFDLRHRKSNRRHCDL